jgi:hypothetical protein
VPFHRWKLLIRGIEKLNIIENDIVVRLKRDPKPCKCRHIYNISKKLKHC